MAHFYQRDLNTFSENIDLIKAAYPNWLVADGERSRLYSELKTYVELEQIKDLMYERRWKEVYCKRYSGRTIKQELVIQLVSQEWCEADVRSQKWDVKKRLLANSEQAAFNIHYYENTKQIRYPLPQIQSAFSEHVGYLFNLSRSIHEITKNTLRINSNMLTSKQEYQLTNAKQLLQDELDPLYMILHA